MSRLSLGFGLGVGYVLGARAGRARYEQIKQAAVSYIERPEVQQALEKARAAAPAPLQGGIATLSRRVSGSQSTSAETVDVDAERVDESDVVVAPAPPASAAGDPFETEAPLPDPLIPPAKSVDTP